MSENYFIPPDCADPSIAGAQYHIADDTNLLRPATNATVRVVPVPEVSEVPPAPEQ